MERLRLLIDSHCWQELGEVLNEKLTASDGDHHFYIEALYLLQLSVFNGASLPKIEFEQVHALLKTSFEKSYVKFSNDPYYLFFVGYFIALGDWSFGQDGLEVSHEMLRRAAELDPNNLLFKWGYSFSTNRADSRGLSREISQSADIQMVLNSFGRAGEFIAEQIRDLPYFLSLPKG